MNSLTKINEKSYRLILEDGQEYICSTWIEKKIKNGESVEYEHVIIPKEAREICGRTYLRTSIVGDYYEFETKTSHREGLGNGGWKSRMTEEERTEWETLETRMNEIKETCMNRKITEEEKLENEVQKLLKKLAELRNQG